MIPQRFLPKPANLCKDILKVPVRPSIRASATIRSVNISRRATYATYKTFNNHHGQTSDLYAFFLRHWKAIAVVGTASGAFYVSNLERAPISDRLRFMLISRSMEERIGNEGYHEILDEYKGSLLPDNHPQVLRVKKIMKRIIKVSGLDDLDWRVHVVNDPKASPNAFVLPSGKVFVFNTILPICGNDDGLATVLAHETAHQVARHTAENLSKAPIYMLINLFLYSVTGSRSLNNILTTSLLQLPASREMETEADFIGLIMMSRACFNPNEAVQVWERMSSFEKRAGALGGKVPEFLSTHPASLRRIENIRNWMPEAMDARTSAGCDDHEQHLPAFFEWTRPRDGIF